MTSILSTQMQGRMLSSNMVIVGSSLCQLHLLYTNLQSHQVPSLCQLQCIQIPMPLLRLRTQLGLSSFSHARLCANFQDLVGRQQFHKDFLNSQCLNVLCLSFSFSTEFFLSMVHSLVCRMFF